MRARADVRGHRGAPTHQVMADLLVAFLVDEGSPVEYRQPVAEIVPFFGGHIIGDSKHA